jgi:hypothetical protein
MYTDKTYTFPCLKKNDRRDNPLSNQHTGKLTSFFSKGSGHIIIILMIISLSIMPALVSPPSAPPHDGNENALGNDPIARPLLCRADCVCVCVCVYLQKNGHECTCWLFGSLMLLVRTRNATDCERKENCRDPERLGRPGNAKSIVYRRD